MITILSFLKTIHTKKNVNIMSLHTYICDVYIFVDVNGFHKGQNFNNNS